MSKLGMLNAQLRAVITNTQKHQTGGNAHTDKRTEKRRIGDRAEDLAERFLRKHGFRSLERNFNCRFGEIDLIALDSRKTEPYLVFVEVRFRTHGDFGGALASITLKKQAKLRQSAQYYCQVRGMHDQACRFDVVCVTGCNLEQLQWIENAF